MSKDYNFDAVSGINNGDISININPCNVSFDDIERIFLTIKDHGVFSMFNVDELYIRSEFDDNEPIVKIAIFINSKIQKEDIGMVVDLEESIERNLQDYYNIEHMVFIDSNK